MRVWKLFALLAAVVITFAGTTMVASSAHASAHGGVTAAVAAPPVKDPCAGLLVTPLQYQMCKAGWEKTCASDPTNPNCAFLNGQTGTGDPVGNAVNDALNSTVVKPMAEGLAQFDLQLIKQGFVVGLGQKSVSIESSGVTTSQTVNSSDGPVTYSLQGYCLALGEGLMVLFAIWAGIRTMLQRKGTPLAKAVQGMALNVILAASGIALLDGLLILSDGITNDLLAIPFGSNFDVGDRMGKVLILTEGYNPMAQLVMAAVVCLMAAGLAIGMFLRQAAIPPQALLLPIAGSGQMGGDTAQKWLPRLWTSMLVVIFYKPCAAFLVAVGFVEIGHGVGLADWIRGVVTMLLAILALPAMMRIFAPFGAAASSATSGGMAGVMMAGAMLAGRPSGGESRGPAAAPTTAVQQAAAMARTAPPAAGDSAPAGTAVQQANRSDAVRVPSPGDGDEGIYLPQQSVAEAGGTPETPSAAPAQAPARPQYTVTMRTAEGVSAAANAAADTTTEGSES